MKLYRTFGFSKCGPGENLQTEINGRTVKQVEIFYFETIAGSSVPAAFQDRMKTCLLK